jgi:uncharacterized membrane protein
VLIQAYSWSIRSTQGMTAIIPEELVLSIVAVLLMGFTGWMGWKMVYRYHAGVSDQPGRTSYPEPPPRR